MSDYTARITRTNLLRWEVRINGTLMTAAMTRWGARRFARRWVRNQHRWERQDEIIPDPYTKAGGR